MATAETRKIELRIEAKDAASPVIGNVRESVENLVRTLQKNTGESSALGSITKMLRGGGAIAGVTLGLGVLDQFATRAKEIAEAFGRGEISAGEIPVALAKALPGMAMVSSMADKLSSTISGAAAAAAQAAAIAANIAKAQTAADAATKVTADIFARSAMLGATPAQALREQAWQQLQRDLAAVEQAEQKAAELSRQLEGMPKRTTAEREARARVREQMQRIEQTAAEAREEALTLYDRQRERAAQLEEEAERERRRQLGERAMGMVQRVMRPFTTTDEQRFNQLIEAQREQLEQQRRDADAMERMWQGIMEDRQQRFRRAAEQAMRRLGPGFSDPGLPGAIDQRFGSASIFAAREQQAALIAALNDHREQTLRKLEEIAQSLQKIVDVESAVEDLFKP
jgi:hypothetical protein